MGKPQSEDGRITTGCIEQPYALPLNEPERCNPLYKSTIDVVS